MDSSSSSPEGLLSLDWEDLRLFLTALEEGTLSKAAEHLGLAQATMSRRIAALEEQVGHTLFDRSRLGLAPTEAALLLAPHAEAMAASANEAASALAGLEDSVAGKVRLAVPPGLAVDLLPPLLPRVRERFPELRLEVLSGNEAVDLVKREADIGVRSMRPTHPDLVFRRLPKVSFGIFVGPQMAAELPAEPAPADLEWVQYSQELVHIPMAQWVEERRGPRPPAFTSNSFLALRAAARCGVGAVLLPVPQGRIVGLVQLEHIVVDLPDLDWFVVLHRALQRVPRIRAVLQILDEESQALDGLSQAT